MRHTMHLWPGVAKQPNLELKTWPKQLLGSLPLVIALPAFFAPFSLPLPVMGFEPLIRGLKVHCFTPEP